MTVLLALTLKAPSRRTLGDGVADSLRHAIFGGVIRAGQRLSEAKIAASLKVSRAPVRDALLSLEQEGLVHRTASGGSIVAKLTNCDVEEICTLRLPLELLAVQRAIAHGTDEDWSRMAQVIRATEQALTPEELAGTDLEFHEALVQAARHSRLLANWQNLRSQIRLIMVQRNVVDDHSRQGTIQGHTNLLASLRARQEKAAISELRQLLQGQYEWVLSSFHQGAEETR
jgi:DNA-binding GntR family transcriptional regulator